MKLKSQTTRPKLIFFVTQATALALIYILFVSIIIKYHSLSAIIVMLVFLLMVQMVFVILLFVLYRPSKTISILMFLTPFTPAFIFWEDLKNILLLKNRRCRQNVPTDTVIVLSYPNWTYWEAWLKPQLLDDELAALIDHLEHEGKSFSVYPKAAVKDVREIMNNADIREVYFVGHGTTTLFGLSNNLPIYYRDFNSAQHSKDFVHQVHCGTRRGKSLIERVVPESNRAKCFFFRKEINSDFIKAEFKRREE